MSNVIKFNAVEERIITLRDAKVIIDVDVADLYGVSTKEVNQAVKNNPDKFPPGYILKTTKEEKSELVKNFDRFNSLKHSTYTPHAFTEKGLYMLATILKSAQATQTTIAIVETFTKIRELSRTVEELSDTEDESRQKSLMQHGGEIFAEIIGNDLHVYDTETTVELNFAVLKLKHTVKRKDK